MGPEGLRIANTPVWCDARVPRSVGFMSRALGGPWPGHRTLLATPETLALQGTQAPPGRVLPCPVFRPFRLGPLTLELLPAGGQLGAAQLRVEHDGGATVYASRVRMGTSPLSLAARVRRCERLVLACPRPGPEAIWPSEAEMHGSLIERVQRALVEGRAPLLLAEPLGVAPELLVVLERAGIPTRCHRRLASVARCCRSFGADVPGRALGRRLPAAHALVWPLALRDSPVLRRLRSELLPIAVDERAVWAADALRRSARTPEVLPWSVRSGVAELLTYVELASPRSVLVAGSGSGPLLESLRARHVPVAAWEQPSQGTLGI